MAALCLREILWRVRLDLAFFVVLFLVVFFALLSCCGVVADFKRESGITGFAHRVITGTGFTTISGDAATIGDAAGTVGGGVAAVVGGGRVTVAMGNPATSSSCHVTVLTCPATQMPALSSTEVAACEVRESTRVSIETKMRSLAVSQYRKEFGDVRSWVIFRFHFLAISRQKYG